jgi:hypothetical protein
MASTESQMTYTLTVPPKYETAITGFVLGAEKPIRGKHWRVEFWHGDLPRVFCDNTRVNKPFSSMRHEVRKFVAEVGANVVNPLLAMEPAQ